MISFGTIGDSNWTRVVQRLEEFQKTYKDKNVRIFGIVTEREAEKVKQWMSKNKITYPVGMEFEEKQGASRYGISKYPTTYIINPSRQVVDRVLGHDDAALKKIQAAVDQAIK
ncbi:MAG: TlpA family protein disulfide reductase [Fimbriimonadia bacterium]|nr:TlpA family protein disulfide reductase [Fimbriimonadia bacterium]